MVTGNKLTAIGDVLTVKSNYPIVNILAVNSFADTLTGITGTRFCTKQFRYSLDGGMNYSGLSELTDVNLQAIPVQIKDVLVFEYVYTRSGTDNTGEIEFISIALDTTPGTLQYPFYGKTFFSTFLEPNAASTLTWYTNVLEKIYKEGITAEYLKRGIDATTDRPFIDTFGSLAHLYAILVCYARVFETFATKENLLYDFLVQRGLYICQNAELAELTILKENFYAQIRARGTAQIYSKEGQVAGELLRLLCYTENDEFVFSLVENNKVGWTIETSSPMYGDVYGAKGLIKGYENSFETIDLTKYPVLNPDYVSVVTDPLSIYDDVIKIDSVPNTETAGIGGIDTAKAITISPWLNYMVEFYVASNEPILANLTFGVSVFDKDDVQISMQSIVDETDTDLFFEKISLNIQQKYYLVRGVLYSAAKNLISADLAKLNIGYGQNLRFKPEAVKIIPIVLNDMESTTGANELLIYGLNITPLEAKNYCFIDLNNPVIGYIVNNNGQHTVEETENIIRKYLLPYKTVPFNTYIEQGTLLMPTFDSTQITFDNEEYTWDNE